MDGLQMIPVIGRIPPPKALPYVMISGVTPSASHLHIVPVRPIPVWISSKISATPYSSQISLTSFKYPFGGTITPASPWIGSRMTAATFSPTAIRLRIALRMSSAFPYSTCCTCCTIGVYGTRYVDLPPMEIAPIDFPWKAPTVEIYQRPPVAIRASFSAISTASAPPFVKKQYCRSPGVISAIAFARYPRSGSRSS